LAFFWHCHLRKQNIFKMKIAILFLIVLLLLQNSYAQNKAKLSYDQLKEYQGQYEYINNTTLKIVASPVDTQMVCFINESRYPFKTLAKDIFLTAVNDTVQFLRNDKGKVNAYIMDKKTFKILDNKIIFPNNIWYAKPNVTAGYKYTYQPPSNDKDGMPIGNLANTNLDKDLLTEMVEKIAKGTYKNIHSILIMKDGKLVFEEYFYEHNKNKLHEMRSATKSYISALTGIAIEKGYIKNVDEKVLDYFPEYTIKNDIEAKKKITLKNLLTNQSGLDCDTYNGNAVGNESIMSYEKDWIQYSLNIPMADSAGGKGQYCSSNPILMGRIIEKATKMTVPEFAKQTLFKDLGINNFIWNFKPDPSSAETYCQVNLRSRDMAKFGQLYQNKGLWNGKQVINKNWVEESFANHSKVAGLDYGYLWWTKGLDVNGTTVFGKLAQGNGGQKIYLYDEHNLVVVVTAGHYNVQSPVHEIVAKYILASFY
jgi:CubicO group peptidase (beta-lactamase class C family)